MRRVVADAQRGRVLVHGPVQERHEAAVALCILPELAGSASLDCPWVDDIGERAVGVTKVVEGVEPPLPDQEPHEHRAIVGVADTPLHLVLLTVGEDARCGEHGLRQVGQRQERAMDDLSLQFDRRPGSVR